jgi:hypothetical protein
LKLLLCITDYNMEWDFIRCYCSVKQIYPGNLIKYKYNFNWYHWIISVDSLVWSHTKLNVGPNVLRLTISQYVILGEYPWCWYGLINLFTGSSHVYYLFSWMDKLPICNCWLLVVFWGQPLLGELFCILFPWYLQM